MERVFDWNYPRMGLLFIMELLALTIPRDITLDILNEMDS